MLTTAGRQRIGHAMDYRRRGFIVALVVVYDHQAEAWKVLYRAHAGAGVTAARQEVIGRADTKKAAEALRAAAAAELMERENGESCETGERYAGAQN